MLKVPCNQNQEFSMCYRVGTDNSVYNYPPDLGCLPNGITVANASIAGANPYWRQSCSDQTWESEYCLNAFNDCPIDTNGNAAVTPCGDPSTALTWCCGEANVQCCGTTAAIKIPLTIGLTSTTSTSLSSSSTSSSTSTSSSSSSQTTPATTSTLSPTETPIPQASGLSTGAKAGIGSGVGVGAVVAILIGLWLLMKRRKRRNTTEGAYGPETSEITEGSHVRGISELDTRMDPKQLDAPVFIHEMEGSRGSAGKNRVGNAYYVDAPYGSVPAELGDGQRRT
ncbi:hypothetical protein V502_04319 [Pseudogymnoascus sp. VKM F-4520 (FW-2644)]|nr:hypothetical protein V502_04319 [Pseudogymnoascus sp. VKM F-4520 (FW-2644)]